MTWTGNLLCPRSWYFFHKLITDRPSGVDWIIRFREYWQMNIFPKSRRIHTNSIKSVLIPRINTNKFHDSYPLHLSNNYLQSLKSPTSLISSKTAVALYLALITYAFLSLISYRHQRWPLDYGREINYWWGTSKSSKTVRILAK